MRAGALLVMLIAIVAMVSGMRGIADAQPILLSIGEEWRYEERATLGGITFRDEDVVSFNPDDNRASFFFRGSSYGVPRGNDIDAIALLPNGNIVFSTEASINGTWNDEDLLLFDGTTLSLYYDFTPYDFLNENDLDALDILDDGSIVFSTLWRFKDPVSRIRFQNEDLALFNPATETFQLYQDFTPYFKANLDAVDILDNGDILFSTGSTVNIAGNRYKDEDLIRFTPATYEFSLFLDGSYFFSKTRHSSDRYPDIDAVAILAVPAPEPSTFLYVVLGGIGWIGWRLRNRAGRSRRDRED